MGTLIKCPLILTTHLLLLLWCEVVLQVQPRAVVEYAGDDWRRCLTMGTSCMRALQM